MAWAGPRGRWGPPPGEGTGDVKDVPGYAPAAMSTGGADHEPASAGEGEPTSGPAAAGTAAVREPAAAGTGSGSGSAASGTGPGSGSAAAMAGAAGGGGERLARNAGIIASATLTSRVAGFVRDAAILAIFGASMADTFVLAFVLPNVLRRLLAEGSLTISFVPVFTARLHKDGQAAARVFADKAFTVASLFLALVVTGGVLGAPWIVELLASDWRADGEKFDLTVRLARWVFPYLWMVGLVALAMGVLNSLRRFFIPAASPVLLNLGIIFGALVLSRWVDPPILGVAYGVLIGGAAQVLLNAFALARSGFAPRPNLRFDDPDLKRLFWLMLPATFGASIHQVNVLLSKAFAASVGDGAVSWLYSADRLIELPLGVIAVSMAVAALPSLSEHAAAGRTEDYKRTLGDGLRQVLFLMVPAAAGLIVLSLPAISVVFQRGAFTHADTVAAAQALALFAVGLPAVAAVRVVVQGFYALQDTRTPVLVGILSVAVFWTGARLLTPPLGHGGIALATSVAAYTNLVFCLALLRRKVGRLGLSRVGATLLRTLPAAAVMGAVALAVARGGVWEAGVGAFGIDALRNVGVFLAAVLLGAATYAGASLALGSPEAKAFGGFLARRLRRRAR
jgi:putative peptidoglycan lipid II flippase